MQEAFGEEWVREHLDEEDLKDTGSAPVLPEVKLEEVDYATKLELITKHSPKVSQLLEDEDMNVRLEIAINTREPKYLEVLAKHPKFTVRKAVASNQLTPREALQKLLKDEKNSVRQAAKQTLKK